MRFINFKLLRILLLLPVITTLFLGMSACGSNVGAAKTPGSPLTVLSIAGGNVSVQKSGATGWTSGKEGLTLAKGDRIKTDDGGEAEITFFDGSIIQLNGDTEISLDELIAKSAASPKTIKIGQKIGETTSTIVKLVDPASKYEIDTQSGVAAVRGSKMFVRVASDNTTSVYNIEGTISFTAQGQEVLIPVGSGSSAKPGEVPSAPQPGLPSGIGVSSGTSISAKIGWQQTALYLNSGDKYYVEYRGGSWTVDYRNFLYVSSAGYSDDVDKKVAAGYKYDSSAPYASLLAKVGTGKEFPVGDQSGPFTADANGFLSLRINDLDPSLVDNDGAVSVSVRPAVIKNTNLTVPAKQTTNAVSGAGWTLDKTPAIQNMTFRSVWVASPSDAFAVGNDTSFQAVVFHYDGKAWSQMSVNSKKEPWGVWGSSSSDVYAVGVEGLILHYDGKTWIDTTGDANFALKAVWGSSSHDIFAAGFSYSNPGPYGVIIHYDGRTWTRMVVPQTAELNSIWGSSPTDVFAVGVNGAVLHYDGSRWSVMPGSTTDTLLAIWGTSPSDVFTAGVNSTILHYDGKAWTAMPGGSKYGMWGIWGSSSSDVYIVGNGGVTMHYDGKVWSSMNAGTYNGLVSICGSSPSDIFAVGTGIVHYHP